MKADVVIMGGGLAALVAGIKLIKSGKSVIIVSSGQSALHFSSGAFGLMSKFGNEEVMQPLKFIDRLPNDHPYRKISKQLPLSSVLDDAKQILKDAGIELKGDHHINHFRLTPFGFFVPSWLTLKDHLTLDSLENIPFRKVAIIGIDGFLDFYPNFLAQGFEKLGVSTNKFSVNIKEFNILRNNPTEMRAPNIARALTDDGVRRYAQVINNHIGDADIAIIPGVVGLNDTQQIKDLRNQVDCKVYTVTTIPVAVPGIRIKILLQQYFSDLGGWYLMGDSVTDGEFVEHRLSHIFTSNLGTTKVSAENYIMATGSYFSRGIKSNNYRVYEPIFNLDVTSSDNRSEWYDRNFFDSQPFMKFGLKTNESFQCYLEGQVLENVYAIGGILGGSFDPLYDGVGGGVTLASSVYVAEHLKDKMS